MKLNIKKNKNKYLKHKNMQSVNFKREFDTMHYLNFVLYRNL